MFRIVIWLIFCAFVGWVASIIVSTDDSQGGFANILLGVVGAVVGGLLASLIGFNGVNSINMLSFIFSVVGAVLFMSLAKMLAG